MASINVRSRGGRRVWLAQVRVKGLRPLSKQFDDRAAAKEWAQAQERSLRRLAQGECAPDASTLALRDLIARYLNDPHSRSLVEADELPQLFGPWLDAYGSHKVRTLPRTWRVDVRDQLVRRGLANGRVNRYLARMRSCWNWGRRSGLIDLSEAWPTGLMLKEPRGRTRYLSDEELAATLQAAREHSELMHAAIVVSIATGVRQGELLRLQQQDVDFGRATLTVRESKNGEQRTVHLPSSAIDALQALRRRAVVGQRVFTLDDGRPLDGSRLDMRWRTIRAKAGLRDCRWHDLRHTAASLLAQNGATLLEIGRQLGHKSPAMTWRYSHLVEGRALPAHAALDEKLRG